MKGLPAMVRRLARMLTDSVVEELPLVCAEDLPVAVCRSQGSGRMDAADDAHKTSRAVGAVWARDSSVKIDDHDTRR
jgi:hypothetical protein